MTVTAELEQGSVEYGKASSERFLFWFIWTKPKPNHPQSLKTPRKTYNNKRAAERALHDMARKHPDQRFFLCAATKGVKHTEPRLDLAAEKAYWEQVALEWPVDSPQYLRVQGALDALNRLADTN